MKLLKEFVSFDQLQVIKEDAVGESGEKIQHFKLKGPFLCAVDKNRNGRIYSEALLTREVKEFYETKIKAKRSLGELDHPDNPQINLARVSHIIEDLHMDGKVGLGIARIMPDTPMGKIAQALVKEGVVLGMSTRGVGSLDGDMVKDDYKLITVDIVADPSAPNAFVEGVLENREWIMDGDRIVEVAITKLKEQVDKKYSGKNMSQYALRYMMEFIKNINNKM